MNVILATSLAEDRRREFVADAAAAQRVRAARQAHASARNSGRPRRTIGPVVRRFRPVHAVQHWLAAGQL